MCGTKTKFKTLLTRKVLTRIYLVTLPLIITVMTISPFRRKVCYVAVEVVVAAAREAGKEMFNEVMDIVEEIENHAEVLEDSLEELLFRPIEQVGRRVSRVVDPEDIGSVAEEEDEDLT